MIRLLSAACILPLPALADVPRVMTDIAPIQSLTAQVMGNLGSPDLLLPPGADPHDFALRPSDAARLGDANVVIWVGAGLTPWLDEPLETLAPQAKHISLLDVEGWSKLDIREVGMEHDDHGDHGDDDDHDDHEANENHDDHDGHDNHDGHDEHKDHDDHHDHDHGDFDPHAWLDPSVAKVWVNAIADALSQADPDNAAIYAVNAADASAELTALEDEVAASLEGFSDIAYVLPHDGYQYFENRFGLEAQAAIAGIDARTPGPAQIAEIRAQMVDENVVCVFSDAAIGERWAQVITEGTAANTVQIDATGVGFEAGPMLYSNLIYGLSNAFINCLGSEK